MTPQTLDHQPTKTAPAAERKIQGIYHPPGPHWVGDGFRVAGYFSSIPGAVRRLSPFLLLDYHAPHSYAPTSKRRGVGPHPHRGFETVTLAWQGSVAHHDSAGGGGVVGPGDVQWMTAASGILHQEYHAEGYARQGGPFQMAQLWVNLPKAHKMDPPGYQGIVAAQIGAVRLQGDGGIVRVIAGEFQGVKGPAKTFTPLNLLDVRLNAAGQVGFSFPPRENTAILLMKGAVSINGAARATEGDFVLFENSGERITIEAETEAHLLVLNGEPIDEPVVQYGPFVMNSDQEIREAITAYNRGDFGHLGA